MCLVGSRSEGCAAVKEFCAFNGHPEALQPDPERQALQLAAACADMEKNAATRQDLLAPKAKPTASGAAGCMDRSNSTPQEQAGAAAGVRPAGAGEGIGRLGEGRSRDPLLVGGHQGCAGAGHLAGLAAVLLVQPRRL